MRLMNKSTHRLEHFLDDQVPPYVVFSHQWGDDECSLHQYSEEYQQSSSKWSAGTAKIIALCDFIADRDEQYVWVDTCCIDKTSSSETQEAINSMYRWYQESSLCVAFLQDVDGHEDNEAATLDAYAKSRWWTRGWTLQELLAPKSEVFVDRKWKVIGSRSDLAQTIEAITGISAQYMGNVKAIRVASVAYRMSWLSSRQTTKVEDLAYCMLGIFDVNLTM